MINASMEDRSGDLLSIARGIKEDVMGSLHSSIPGIINSFDPVTQSAEVQVAIRRRVKHEDGVREVDDPLLMNVPVCFLGGGSTYLTFPVQKGDECIVFFADRCIDAWYQSSGVQNQVMPRMHDLSDGFALVGFRSIPKAIPNFNTEKPSVTGGFVVDGRDVSVQDCFRIGYVYISTINTPPDALPGHIWEALTPETVFGTMTYAWSYKEIE